MKDKHMWGKMAKGKGPTDNAEKQNWSVMKTKASTLNNNEMRMIGNQYARGLPGGLGPWREYDNNVPSQPL